jgi:deoxyribodipyrimidine photo-lyase
VPTVSAPAAPYAGAMDRLPDNVDLGSLLPRERLRLLRPGRSGAGPVVAWLRRSHRTRDNAALETAAALASRRHRPLLAIAVVDPAEEGLTERSALFALQGLRDLRDGLRQRGVGVVVAAGETVATVRALVQGASALVVDRAYLRAERAALDAIVASLDVTVLEVEANVVVPVECASQRAAFMARSLRAPLQRLAERFVGEVPKVAVARPWPDEPYPPAAGVRDVTSDLDEPERLLAGLDLDARARPVGLRGGETAALATLDRFVEERLERYVVDRRLPHRESSSGLGPYLRFGHVSPGAVLRRVHGAEAPADARSAFAEELLVRRELAVNHVAFTPDYDRWEGLPRWARATLEAHAVDPRPHRYDRSDFEGSATHDPVWNAAMTQLRETGWLHNHMRMYWGKKLLEWSEGPQQAYEWARDLNDTYLLDGRDANSYAGVGWIFGLHDRPWPARPIYGTVRSMTIGGLKRSSDPEAYVSMVRELTTTTGAVTARG